MRSVAVVAWREIVDHRNFLVAALAALVITVVVPLAPTFLGWSPTDVREVLMWVMTLGFTWLSAVLLGASMVSGVVAAGRLGFFLSRPVSSAAIWFGKLMGVLTVAWLGELLILVPSALLADRSTYVAYLARETWPAIAVVFGVPALLVLVAHGVATRWRAGTAWIALDLVSLGVVGTIAWLVVGSLLDVGAVGAATVLGLVLVAFLMAALTAAGAVQIAAGRSDRRRQRRAFASILWPVLLVSVVAAAAASWWLRSPQAEDLTTVEDLAVQPAGRWIVVSGPTRGRFDVSGSFALDLELGTSVRLALNSRWSSGSAAAFSPDGRAAVWPVRDGDDWRIRFAHLDELPGGTEDSLIFLDERPAMVLSPSGGRMATIDDEILTVMDVGSGALIGSVRLPSGSRVVGRYFVGEDLVRVVTERPQGEDDSDYDWRSPRLLQALEFNLTAVELVEAGTLAGAGQVIAATLDEGRDRLLLRMVRDSGSIWRYVDARTLAVIDWSAGRQFAPITEMLADGRLVRFINQDGESWLERLTPDGEIDGRARLPSKPARAVIGFQPTSSTVAVAVKGRDGDEDSLRWALLVADLDAGEVREIDEDSVPLRWSYSFGEVTTPLPAGSPAARLFYGDSYSGSGSSLWLWDPVRGEKEPVVGSRG
jgi:hypothetical protein